MAPKYFEAVKYQNPTSKFETPFQFAHGTDSSYFEWMQQTPAIMSNFSAFMEVVRADRVNWIDWFPVQEQLINGAKTGNEAVFMIDVGGGRGQDLIAFRNRYPGAPGKLMLQDQQHVIDSANIEGIEKMGHDFFTAQPVKGQ